MARNTRQIFVKQLRRFAFPMGFFLAVITYVLVFEGPLTRRPVFQGNALEYIRDSQQPLWSSRFWRGIRTPVLPLLIKACFHNYLAVSVVQTLLSAFSWATFAFVAGHQFRTRSARFLLYAVLFLLAVSKTTTSYNRVLLSESLSISGFLILLSLLLHFFRSLARSTCYESVRRMRISILLQACLIVVISGIYLFTRDGNTMALALLLVILTLARFSGALRRTFFRRTYPFMAGVLLLLLVGNTYWAGSRVLWKEAFFNIITSRVLEVPEYTAYFEERGLPVTPELRTFVGKPFYYNNRQMLRLNDVRVWVANKGKAVYTTFLLTHPRHTFGLAWKEAKIAATRELGFFYSGYPYDGRMPHVLQMGISLIQLGKPLLYMSLAAMIGLFFAGLLGRTGEDLRLFPIAWLIYESAASLIFVIHADVYETSRHCLVPILGLQIGIWLLLATGLEQCVRAVAARIERNASVNVDNDAQIV